MWTITAQKSDNTFGDTYCLLPIKEKYSIGRANVDINLKNDSSISRTHAFLYPTDSCVKILDNNSKYGVFLNENIAAKFSIEKNKKFHLQSNDRIKFGILENEWILQKLEIKTLISTLNMEQKKNLQNILKFLNGTIADKLTVEQESTYTHLTMEKITVTTKLLYALGDKIPIVNSKYWKDFLLAAQNCQVLPKSEDYLPIITEEFVHINRELLLSNVDRKDLFKNKIFYFTNNKHLTDYVPVVTKIGGKLVPLTTNVSKSLLLDANAIVIHNKNMAETQPQVSQAMIDLGEFLKKNSLRLVPDFEIGLAVVYNSIENYCNPRFNALNVICKPTKNLPTNEAVIVEETPQFKAPQASEQLLDSIEIPDSDVAKSHSKETKQNIAAFSEEIVIDSDDDFQLLANVSDEQLLSEHENKISGKKKPNDSLEFEKNKNQPSTSIFAKRKISKSPEAEPQQKRLHLDDSQAVSQAPSFQAPSFTGFLSKSMLSQRIAAHPELLANESQAASQSNETQRQKKRGRFATLDSDDENDDNLFDFGGAAKKPKSQSQTNKENSGGLFGFFQEKPKAKPQKTYSKTKAPTTTANTSTAVTSKVEKSINSQTARATYTPIDLTSVAWLSKSFIKLEVNKAEDEENEKKLDPSQMKYIESIKNGFEVQVKPMNLVSRSFGNSNINVSNSSGSSSSTGKNFKAFVKKQNFRAQKEIIGTVPVNISGFEF